VLERIKHFFAVANVHFVLGANLEQLRCSICAAYGTALDANTYLQKFIHLTFHLIDHARFPEEKTETRFIDYLAAAMVLNTEGARQAVRVIKHVAVHRGLSLRAIESVFTTLALAIAYAPDRTLTPPPILGGLCVLKITEPHLYRSAKQGTLTFAQVREKLYLGESDTPQWIVDWWRLCTDMDMAPEDLEKLSMAKSLWQFNVERNEVVRHVANNVVDRFTLRA
jgi:hypothetical protein